MNEEYLTAEEVESLRLFLKNRKISFAEVGRIVNRAAATIGNYWFKEKKIKRLVARELIKEIKDRALKGFEEVEKI